MLDRNSVGESKKQRDRTNKYNLSFHNIQLESRICPQQTSVGRANRARKQGQVHITGSGNNEKETEKGKESKYTAHSVVNMCKLALALEMLIHAYTPPQ